MQQLLANMQQQQQQGGGGVNTGGEGDEDMNNNNNANNNNIAGQLGGDANINNRKCNHCNTLKLMLLFCVNSE